MKEEDKWTFRSSRPCKAGHGVNKKGSRGHQFANATKENHALIPHQMLKVSKRLTALFDIIQS